jgi:hypothetical protein
MHEYMDLVLFLLQVLVVGIKVLEILHDMILTGIKSLTVQTPVMVSPPPIFPITCSALDRHWWLCWWCCSVAKTPPVLPS